MNDDRQHDALERKDEFLNLIRGAANSLVLDSKTWRTIAPFEMDPKLQKAYWKAVKDFLKSDDPQLVKLGLQQMQFLRQQDIRILELELELAQKGMQAVTTFSVAELRSQANRQRTALSRETADAVIMRMMAGPRLVRPDGQEGSAEPATKTAG